MVAVADLILELIAAGLGGVIGGIIAGFISYRVFAMRRDKHWKRVDA
jgi:hypothetical protein